MDFCNKKIRQIVVSGNNVAIATDNGSKAFFTTLNLCLSKFQVATGL